MTVSYYRLCFDPQDVSRQFTDADAFKTWCAEHLSGLDYQHAGYMICPWHATVNTTGLPLWNVLVRASDSYADFEQTVYTFLSERKWTIDGFTVIPYIKPAMGENEILFPVHEVLPCGT